MNKLTGKVAIVTGASKGIGAAIAKKIGTVGRRSCGELFSPGLFDPRTNEILVRACSAREAPKS
jgi:hypothetical protein